MRIMHIRTPVAITFKQSTRFHLCFITYDKILSDVTYWDGSLSGTDSFLDMEMG